MKRIGALLIGILCLGLVVWFLVQSPESQKKAVPSSPKEPPEEQPEEQSHYPEKKMIDIAIEGQPQTVEAQLAERLTYLMYVDPLTVKASGEKDELSLSSVSPLPEGYAPIYLKITPTSILSNQQAIEALAEEKMVDFESVYPAEKVEKPIREATVWNKRGVQKQDAKGQVLDLYLVESQKNQHYLIEISYPIEAQEGYGGIFYYLLETLQFK